MEFGCGRLGCGVQGDVVGGDVLDYVDEELMFDGFDVFVQGVFGVVGVDLYVFLSEDWFGVDVVVYYDYVCVGLCYVCGECVVYVVCVGEFWQVGGVCVDQVW